RFRTRPMRSAPSCRGPDTRRSLYRDPMPNVTEARPAPLNRAGAGRFTRQERLAYTMLVPILGSIFLIVTYPFVLAVIQSLQATNGGAFVGLQNYVTGLENPL